MRLPDVKKATDAASRGDLSALRSLLNAQPELAEDSRLINAAALMGQPEAARLLLSAGADPDAVVPSHEAYRPLHRAIEHRGFPKNPGHRAVVEALLEAGASLETRSTWRQITPLAVAGMEGDEEMIALLLEHGAPVDIFAAAITADAARVRKFLRAKSTPRQDENNMTVLHYAALSGLGEKSPQALRQITEALLEDGGDGNACTQIGPYPNIPVLHFAAYENFPVAETLLSHGCDPDHGFGQCLWRTPGRMAELFLAHGANANFRDSAGQPLLNSRIHWNLPSVALWLLQNGADPTQTDAQGNTALHEAATRGINPQVIQAIIEHGGKKASRNKEGKTPLDLAKEKKRAKVIPLL